MDVRCESCQQLVSYESLNIDQGEIRCPKCHTPLHIRQPNLTPAYGLAPPRARFLSSISPVRAFQHTEEDRAKDESLTYTGRRPTQPMGSPQVTTPPMGQPPIASESVEPVRQRVLTQIFQHALKSPEPKAETPEDIDDMWRSVAAERMAQPSAPLRPDSKRSLLDVMKSESPAPRRPVQAIPLSALPARERATQNLPKVPLPPKVEAPTQAPKVEAPTQAPKVEAPTQAPKVEAPAPTVEPVMETASLPINEAPPHNEPEATQLKTPEPAPEPAPEPIPPNPAPEDPTQEPAVETILPSKGPGTVPLVAMALVVLVLLILALAKRSGTGSAVQNPQQGTPDLRTLDLQAPQDLTAPLVDLALPDLAAPPDLSTPVDLQPLVETKAPLATPATLLSQARALLGSGKPREAQKIYEELLPRLPGSIEVRVGLGDCALRTEHYLAASEHYRNALAKRADYPPAVFGLAEAFRLRGQHQEALAHYRTYLKTKGASIASSRQAQIQIKRLEGLLEKDKPAPEPEAAPK